MSVESLLLVKFERFCQLKRGLRADQKPLEYIKSVFVKPSAKSFRFE